MGFRVEVAPTIHSFETFLAEFPVEILGETSNIPCNSSRQRPLK